MGTLSIMIAAVAWCAMAATIITPFALLLLPISERLLTLPDEHAPAQLATAGRAAHSSPSCHARGEL